MPLIKRYPNRKLYDTEAKSYVTLDDITQMIRAGQDVHVIDHETGDDLTSLTYTQIILEQEKKKTGFLPRSLLASLIRTGGDTLEQVVRSVQSGLGATSVADGDDGEERSDKARTAKPVHSSLAAVDDRIADVLHMLNVPTRRDMHTLQEQLAALTTRLEELATADREQPTPDTAAPSNSDGDTGK